MSRLRTFIALGRARVVPRVLRGAPATEVPKRRSFFTMDDQRAPLFLFAGSGGICGVCLELVGRSGVDQLLFASMGQLALVGTLLGALIGTILVQLSEKSTFALRVTSLFGILLMLMSVGAEWGWITQHATARGSSQTHNSLPEGMIAGAVIGASVGVLLITLLALRIRWEASRLLRSEAKEQQGQRASENLIVSSF